MDILNEKIKGLVTKADKSGMPYSILKKVYDRGMAAWKTGHRPGTTPQQWAFARVNSFVTKSSGTWGKADADLAKQVRGEEVQEKRITASKIIGQVKEKLPKDADAGDYVKDFKKSDAPQFKGKSDKKKEKMAVAAYLDSKEEVELEEGQAGRFRSAGAELERYAKKSGRMDKNDFIKAAGMMKKGDSHGLVKFVKSLDTEPRDYVIQTVKRAVGKDLTQKMFSVKIKEEKRQLKDPKKEAMVMKVKDSGSIQVIDKKDLEKYLRKGYIQVENNIQEALKHSYVLIDTSRNNKVVGSGSDKKSLEMDINTANLPPLNIKNKSALKVVKLKRPKSDNMAGKLLGEPLKSWGEETDIQESGHTDVASMKTQVQIATDALQKMNTELGKLSDEEDLPTWWTNKVATAVGKLDGMADYIDAKSDQGQKMNESNLTEEKVFVVRFEKEGMRFAVPFSDMKRAKDGEKILKKSAGVSNVSVTKDILKPGVSMSKFRTQQEGKIVAESKMGELFLDMQMDAQEMSERDFIKTYSRQGFQAAELKRMHKEFNEEVEIGEGAPRKPLKKMSVRDVSKDVDGIKKGKELRIDGVKNPSELVKQLKDKYGSKIKAYVGPTNITVTKEELDNSLASQTMRVISQTSIKEKIDPADVDDVATADDRKAADKNIIIQLRRAQDMQGKADVTFKDKPSKKEKIDIRVINKALDMFDKMRPNDKAKMQTMIGKSYRDLLKTVQRGRI